MQDPALPSPGDIRFLHSNLNQLIITRISLLLHCCSRGTGSGGSRNSCSCTPGSWELLRSGLLGHIALTSLSSGCPALSQDLPCSFPWAEPQGSKEKFPLAPEILGLCPVCPERQGKDGITITAMCCSTPSDKNVPLIQSNSLKRQMFSRT